MANEIRQLNYLPYAKVTWKIFNNIIPIKADYLIESQKFNTLLNETVTWKLAISGSRRENGEHRTGIILRRLSPVSEKDSKDVRVKIVVEDRSDKVLFKGNVSFGEGDEISLGSSDILRDGIPKCNRISNIESIRITCDFLYDDPFNTIDKDLKHLAVDLGDLHSSESLCNLYLNYRGGRRPVHRAIVNVRSPYIARILEKNPHRGEIDLTDKCSEIQLDGLIKYWYTGNFTEISQTQSPSNLNSVLNLEQQELSPYIDHGATALSSTLSDALDIQWVFEESRNKMKILDNSLDKMYTSVSKDGKLYFYPKGESGKADYIALRIDINPESYPVFIQVYHLHDNNSKHGCKSTFCSEHGLRVFRFPEFMKREELKRNVQADKELRFGCTICKVKQEKSDVWDPGFKILPENPYKIFAIKMKELLESQKFTDISLKIGDKPFDVHKAILVARSEYFKNMLRDRRDLSASIDIPVNVEPNYLSIILEYMYCAESTALKEMTLESAIKLYPFLYTYKIKHFQPACFDYLRRSVAKNSQEILELAKQVGDKDLERLASSTL